MLPSSSTTLKNCG